MKTFPYSDTFPYLDKGISLFREAFQIEIEACPYSDRGLSFLPPGNLGVSLKIMETCSLNLRMLPTFLPLKEQPWCVRKIWGLPF